MRARCTGTLTIGMNTLVFETETGRWRTRFDRACDISLPLIFDGAQPRFFHAAAARAHAFTSGDFQGDVRLGASCNCSTYTLTAHCNGTHTECVGHITRERVSVRDVAPQSLLPTQLITIEPMTMDDGDRVIGAEQVRAIAAATSNGASAMVIRTLPNSSAKLTRDYDVERAAYFAPDAVQSLVAMGIEHVVTDLPSLDRAHDGGKLAAHRVFWGMPVGVTSVAQATRTRATVTELVFIPDSVPDGFYLLNLQVAPFVADAAPSRPVLYPLERVV